MKGRAGLEEGLRARQRNEKGETGSAAEIRRAVVQVQFPGFVRDARLRVCEVISPLGHLVNLPHTAAMRVRSAAFLGGYYAFLLILTHF